MALQLPFGPVPSIRITSETRFVRKDVPPNVVHIGHRLQPCLGQNRRLVSGTVLPIKSVNESNEVGSETAVVWHSHMRVLRGRGGHDEHPTPAHTHAFDPTSDAAVQSQNGQAFVQAEVRLAFVVWAGLIYAAVHFLHRGAATGRQ